VRPIAAVLAASAVAALAQPVASIAAFSTAGAGGAIPAPWRRVAIPQVNSPEFTLADDAGRTVLRVRADSAAGSLAHDLSATPAATPIGTTGWSPYTQRVRIVVLESGDAQAGQWVSETRDLEADFRTAFGGPAPRVTAVLVASDTDQTRASAIAWFGDLRLEARR